MYVVVQYQMCELKFWSGTDTRRDSVWTSRFDAAVKFADYESGLRVLTDLCDGNGRVEEHAYITDQARAVLQSEGK